MRLPAQKVFRGKGSLLCITPHKVFSGIIAQLSEMYLLTRCYRYEAEGTKAYSLYFECPTTQ